MAYRKQRVADLARAVGRTLEGLDLGRDAEAYDAWIDPSALAEALQSDVDAVLIRAGRELEAAEEGYAALPGECLFLLVQRGADMRLAPLDLAADRGDVTEVTAASLSVESVTVPCCDSPKCDADKDVHRLTLQLEEGEPLLLGESFDAAALTAVAAGLAKRLDVELTADEQAPAGDATPSEPMSAQALARWTLRREGDLFVLRDHASLGPREDAPKEWLATVALAVGGAAAWVAAYWAYRDQSYQTVAIGAAIALVLTLAAWAMSHIARHSARYRAASEALFCASQDRLVVAPWHSRSGAVNTRPEGRYGAALRVKDVESIDVVPDEGGFTLRATSTHGPYDIGTLESEAQAKAWRSVMLRLLERVSHHALAAAMVLLLACSPTPVSQDPVAQPLASAGAPTLSAATIASSPAPTAAPASSTVAAHGLAIVEDDLPKAMKEAAADGKAVFVEVWAPWCHTCLSMKNFVLPDPSIAALQKRVVFAALDSDRPKNEAFMERYAVMVWPTLYVLDPASGGVLGLWQGAASVKELRQFITAAVDGRDATLDPKGALAAMIAAKQAHAAADWKKATVSYQQAIDRGGKTWERRSEALAGLQFAAYRRGQWERCAQLGYEHLEEIEGAAIPADFAWVTLRCSEEVKDGALRKKAHKRALARLKRHTDKPPAGASVDDKSDALSIYAGALRDAGDAEGARAALLRQIAILEAAAKAAPGSKEASTFDYARMNAYLAVGKGDRAVTMLEARVTELPDSYEPPARLAQALMALKRHKEAQVPMAAAVAKSYGPRKLRYLSMQADLRQKLGNHAGERESLKLLVDAYDKLSAGQRKHPPTKRLADSAKKRLAAAKP